MRLCQSSHLQNSGQPPELFISVSKSAITLATVLIQKHTGTHNTRTYNNTKTTGSFTEMMTHYHCFNDFLHKSLFHHRVTPLHFIDCWVYVTKMNQGCRNQLQYTSCYLCISFSCSCENYCKLLYSSLHYLLWKRRWTKNHAAEVP